MFSPLILSKGFDVPAANVVICFDHMKSSVELCQRFGRARQDNSSTVVMEERKDRPVARLQEVKRRQDDIIVAFDPSKMYHADSDMATQKCYERSAFSILANESRCLMIPIAALNEYITKTKASIEHKPSKNSWKFHHEMGYKSIIRSESATATGHSKKEAKLNAP